MALPPPSPGGGWCFVSVIVFYPAFGAVVCFASQVDIVLGAISRLFTLVFLFGFRGLFCWWYCGRCEMGGWRVYRFWSTLGFVDLLLFRTVRLLRSIYYHSPISKEKKSESPTKDSAKTLNKMQFSTVVLTLFLFFGSVRANCTEKNGTVGEYIVEFEKGYVRFAFSSSFLFIFSQTI